MSLAINLSSETWYAVVGVGMILPGAAEGSISGGTALLTLPLTTGMAVTARGREGMRKAIAMRSVSSAGMVGAGEISALADDAGCVCSASPSSSDGVGVCAAAAAAASVCVVVWEMVRACPAWCCCTHHSLGAVLPVDRRVR